VSKDRRKDLHLISEEGEGIEPGQLDEATAALRAALAPDPLDAMDHEALLAMTLGDDVSEVDDVEARAAAELRDALQRGAPHPLAELAMALRAAHGASGGVAASEETDMELLLALSLGGDHADLADQPRAEAAAFAEAFAAGDRAHPAVMFAESLRHAADAEPLARADADTLLAIGLAVEVEVTAEEESASQALAEALEGARTDHPLVGLIGALRAAAGQLPGLGELQHQRLIRQAMDRVPQRTGERRSVVIGAIVALAAGMALFFGSMSWLETRGGPTAQRGPAQQAIEARSTQELFDPAEPFPVRGGESDRMGRIVSSRASDLRANRFAAWGVR
jgi:hypothetical protein